MMMMMKLKYHHHASNKFYSSVQLEMIANIAQGKQRKETRAKRKKNGKRGTHRRERGREKQRSKQASNIGRKRNVMVVSFSFSDPHKSNKLVLYVCVCVVCAYC